MILIFLNIIQVYMGNYKYEKLSSWLKEKIESGEFPADSRIPTELELSRQFNISRDTVRTGISQLETEGLLVRRKGSGTYVNKPAPAPFLPQKTASKTIAVIVNETDNYIFPAIINGINQKLMDHGYNCAMYFTSYQFLQERRVLKYALNGDYAGLIIEPAKSGLPNMNIDLYEEIARRKPTLLMHAKFQIPNLSDITSGDEEAGYILTKYLIEQGHKDIAYFCKLDEYPGRKRYQGYLRAFRETGLKLEDKNILCFLTEDAPYLFGYPINPRTVEILNRCSVVICHNDCYAYKLHNFITQQHMSIQIAGFDNSPIGEGICSITVTHHQKDFGETAAERLLEKIQFPGRDVSFDFSPELVIRQS